MTLGISGGAAIAGAKLNAVKSPFSTTEAPTPYQDVTTYNNFYEFGTAKSDPSYTAKNFRTIPWTISIEGAVAKPQVLDLDALLRIAPLEERIYRHRCVEAWSIVVPWIGFPLNALLKAVDPLSSAKYVAQFTRFRRMLGLFAFFYGSLHFLTYLWLDKSFDLAEILGNIGKRPFITIGFTSLMLVVPLAVTSTAGWIKRIGPRRWQWLHRLIYISSVAAVIHYYWLVKSDIRLPALYATILMLLLTARLPGLRANRSKRTTTLRLLSIKRQTNDTIVREPAAGRETRAVSHIRLDRRWQEAAALLLDIVIAVAHRLC
ncbi:MAG: methionine sulfoxide reductase heme-binding subunit [Verrucomicrobiota bacterium]